MAVFEQKEKDGVVWFSCQAFEEVPGLIQGFSTRKGGVSREHLASMNLSFARGDDPENVRENFRRMGNALGFDTESLVFSHQTHTANVRAVGAEDRGKGFVTPLDYSDVDGLATVVADKT